MAIFGAGSNWDGEELKEDFISGEYFTVGWDYSQAKDLFDSVSALKAGDIIYLKANASGSKSIRIKAIGVVKHTVIHSLYNRVITTGQTSNQFNFHVPVKWIRIQEFFITIPIGEGKLTNVRASTFYEEHLPLVQQAILQKLFNRNFKNPTIMDYGLGQFITGVIAVGLQVLQLWKETKSVAAVQSKVNQFDEITQSPDIVTEGLQLQQLVPLPVLNTLKGRVEVCWTDFQDAVGNHNITPKQLDRYTEGLTACICRELRVIKRLNGNLPTEKMIAWWNEYKCE